MRKFFSGDMREGDDMIYYSDLFMSKQRSMRGALRSYFTYFLSKSEIALSGKIRFLTGENRSSHAILANNITYNVIRSINLLLSF